jgi:glutamyl-Q tRNA(Asp) synthetase
VRIEDLDSARVVPGCAAEILTTLEAFSLTWDGEVVYQSARRAHYLETLQQLTARGLTFECSCSRRELEGDGGYPGTCRQGPARPGPTATRFRMADEPLVVEDRAQGRCAFDPAERGDVVIRRRDGVIAYQLAVVVDDAWQGITDVVRGADLLDSTPWQVALQRALGLPTPTYLHLPLIVEPGGEKLAKARRSVPVDPRSAGPLIHEALRLLRQGPPAELKSEPATRILEWGCSHWRPNRLRQVREIRARK